MITALSRVLVAFFLSGASAWAHDPGLSDSHIELWPDRVEVRLHIDPGAHASARAPELGDPIRLAIDGAALPLLDEPSREGDRFEARFRRLPGRELHLELRLFETLGAGHKHYMKIDLGGRADRVERLVSAGAPVVRVPLPESPPR